MVRTAAGERAKLAAQGDDRHGRDPTLAHEARS
jgi:hypothetical protein